MREGALIYNPAAGRRRAERLRAAVGAALHAGGWRVEAYATDAAGAATTMARRLAASGSVEAVFALGGDGTLREVAAGLLGSEVALGPLPGGTSNVLTRSLGVPRDPLAAARLLAGAPRRAIRAGRCDGEPFLMMVSAGFDAAVVATMDGALKARWGLAGVAWTGLPAWWRYDYPLVEVGTGDVRDAAPFVAVCNIPHYGGPYCLAPGARCDDDSLELVLYRRRGRLAALGFLRDLARGRHHHRPDVAIRTCTGEVTLDGPAGTPLQVDGDPWRGPLPLTVGVHQHPLWILAPPATPSA